LYLASPEKPYLNISINKKANDFMSGYLF